jgi:hypothetical protein
VLPLLCSIPWLLTCHHLCPVALKE